MTTQSDKMNKKTSSQSAWSPLRHTAFTVLWTATVISNTGTWMHDAAAGWLMTSLAPDPFMVALVQAATTLPVFFLALPAGAMADIIDRRRLLIIITLFMATMTSLLGVSVYLDKATPLTLILITLCLGSGTAFLMPTWQAIVPQLVPRDQLHNAITINSAGINISRAIGPALGGVLIASVGLAAPFFFNAVSFFVVIAAVLWWQPPERTVSLLPSERLFGALRQGLRYARASLLMRATMLRSIGFFLFASAYWALLPLIARQQLGGGPQFYGILLGCLGIGAVMGALLLPRLRTFLNVDQIVYMGTVVTAITLCVFATVANKYAASGVSFLAGAAWLTVLSTLNVSAQLSLPEWVRARGVAVFYMILFGSLALGSALWGQIAGTIGIPATLLIAAAGSIIAIPATWHWKLPQAGEIDFSPSSLPEPVIAGPIEGERGPVMITIEYHVDEKDKNAFLGSINKLSRTRRRGGAFSWGVFEDARKPGHYLEYFMVESWLEHLRQHERTTKSDTAAQDEVMAFHKGRRKPRVEHYIAPERQTPHLDD